MTRDELRTDIIRYVGMGYRYRHVLGVEEECAYLAELFKLPDDEREELLTAALLHDITKRRSAEEQKALYRRYGLPFGVTEENCPKTLHAVTGAYFAMETYPSLVTDRIFNAILNHTAGAPGMTQFDKLLSLADYTEPNRTFTDCVSLRQYFHEGASHEPLALLLDKAMLLSFRFTLDGLLKSGEFIHPQTVAARNFILLSITGDN